MLTNEARQALDRDDARDASIVVTVSFMVFDTEGAQPYKIRAEEVYYPNAQEALSVEGPDSIGSLTVDLIEDVLPGLQQATDIVVWGRKIATDDSGVPRS